MNVLYAGLLLLGMSLSLIRLGGEGTLSALLLGGQSAVELCLKMAGGYLFWMGVLELTRRSGAARALGRLLSPLIRLCCPTAGDAAEPIALSLSANMLGLSGAATPFALDAMARLERNNPHPGTATDDMCALLILNAGCLKLLPTAQIAMRQACGSLSPGAILVPSLLATGVSCLCAIALAWALRRS